MTELNGYIDLTGVLILVYYLRPVIIYLGFDTNLDNRKCMPGVVPHSGTSLIIIIRFRTFTGLLNLHSLPGARFRLLIRSFLSGNFKS